MDTDRSPITGIRIKEDLWQRIKDYHNEFYPDTKFIISSTVMELIDLGLESKGIKRNVKSSNEFVTLTEFDAFRGEVTQQIALLNSQLNARLNQPSQVESSGKGTVDTVEKSSGNRPFEDKSFEEAISLARKMMANGEKTKVIEIFLTEEGYRGVSGKPINWKYQLQRLMNSVK